MRITMIAAAKAEMHRAARWYERRGNGLGHRLLDDVRASLLAVRDFPVAFPTIDPSYRKKLLDVFPYALIYRVEADEVIIVAVANLKRRPRYWRSRVS